MGTRGHWLKPERTRRQGRGQREMHTHLCACICAHILMNVDKHLHTYTEFFLLHTQGHTCIQIHHFPPILNILYMEVNLCHQTYILLETITTFKWTVDEIHSHSPSNDRIDVISAFSTKLILTEYTQLSRQRNLIIMPWIGLKNHNWKTGVPYNNIL